MLKIPYGIIDYKKLVTEGYYYIDKTMYLETLEEVGDVLIYLRPGRFGKSLFTSMLYYYYDIKSKDNFKSLFCNTYIYNNPTKNKNNYYILKLDFSGITTSNKNSLELEEEFLKKISDSIKRFNDDYKVSAVADYNNNTAGGLLLQFLSYFKSLDLDNKLYILIDEYDNFTNAILEGEAERFKNIVGNEGFVKNFYATIKEYIGLGVIDRVFITGICPITLDSMTTGFNIATDVSNDVRLNSMIGLTHEEVKKMLVDMEIDNQEEVFNLMVDNYDGYLFNKNSENRIFNATLVMYFLKYYYDFNKIPEQLLDPNIAFNYGKVENLLKLQNNEFYKEIIDTILKYDTVNGSLKLKFNLEVPFNRDDIISLLYYFGYLTLNNASYGNSIDFKVPNKVMQKIYSEYFLKILNDAKIFIDNRKRVEAIKEIVTTSKIELISRYVEEILRLSDNRIFMNLDEKYIQIIYFSLLVDSSEYNIYNEYPCKCGYIDLYLKGNCEEFKNDIMIELKYIKLKEYRKNKKILDIKREEAREQLKQYSKDERINSENLKRYVVIFIGNNLKLIEEV